MAKRPLDSHIRRSPGFPMRFVRVLVQLVRHPEGQDRRFTTGLLALRVTYSHRWAMPMHLP